MAAARINRSVRKIVNGLVRFDEIAGISMGFLGVRQGNAGVLL
jgi:hypothetical protein